MSDERFPLYRHGDVLVQRIDAIPVGARDVPGTVLARGHHPRRCGASAR